MIRKLQGAENKVKSGSDGSQEEVRKIREDLMKEEEREVKLANLYFRDV